jgi:hypothetical protein
MEHYQKHYDEDQVLQICVLLLQLVGRGALHLELNLPRA